MKKTNAIKQAAVVLTAAFGLAITTAAQGAKPTLPPASTKQGVTFATDIKPIFDASCTKCHSGKRPKGHLKLDSLAGVLKGGKDGKILKPGDSADSDLIRRIAHLNSDHRAWMPPLHNRAGIKPLTPAQISLVRAWIDQGAK